jgi:hypothetical protein
VDRRKPGRFTSFVGGMGARSGLIAVDFNQWRKAGAMPLRRRQTNGVLP